MQFFWKMSALNHLPEKFICIVALNYPGHPLFFFPFLQLYQGNLQELSSQFPSAEHSHPQHLLRVKFAAAFEGGSCCAKRCLFLLLQMMQRQGQLTRSFSWRVGCMTRSAPDCGYGAHYLLAGGDSEERRLHQISLQAQ